MFDACEQIFSFNQSSDSCNNNLSSTFLFYDRDDLHGLRERLHKISSGIKGVGVEAVLASCVETSCKVTGCGVEAALDWLAT